MQHFNPFAMWAPEYIRKTRSVQCLLIPWLLASPKSSEGILLTVRHKVFCTMRKGFNCLCHFSLVNDKKCTNILIFPHNIISKQRINPLHAKFFTGNKNIFLHFMPYLHSDMPQGSWNPSSSKTRTHLFYKINIMAADVLATKGARASATMILT